MAFEGTGKYFLLLFLVFFIVYVTVKVSLSFLLKRAKEDAWKAYVPFYTTLVLVDLLGLKRNVFYLSLIPFVNLYYYYIIIGKLLEGFGLNPKEAIWFIVIPMYKFPELAFRKPKFKLNEYDLTQEFLETQNALFEKPEDELPDQLNLVDLNKAVSGEAISDAGYTEPVQEASVFDIPTPDEAESVFTNEELQPNESQVTYVEVEEEKPEAEKPMITPLDDGKPKVCPNCGAKLSPSAETCFLCGHKLN